MKFTILCSVSVKDDQHLQRIDTEDTRLASSVSVSHSGASLSDLVTVRGSSAVSNNEGSAAPDGSTASRWQSATAILQERMPSTGQANLSASMRALRLSLLKQRRLQWGLLRQLSGGGSKARGGLALLRLPPETRILAAACLVGLLTGSSVVLFNDAVSCCSGKAEEWQQTSLRAVPRPTQEQRLPNGSALKRGSIRHLVWTSQSSPKAPSIPMVRGHFPL